ncbi:MAG: Asp-tRNA(Asn)/Glu-tRNA(Gln) amidotransferase subunit GatB [Planctomycetota bacterium]
MKHRVLIGMEVHLQLKTRSKMFCRCPVRFGEKPNSLVCPVCLGMPGALPVPNRDAMIMALSLASALGCEIPDRTRFERKSYFYPDLPKGYQISQLGRPLGSGGMLEIVTEEGVKPVQLRRLHIEEDAGKSVHDADADLSRVDFNRAGTPLVEVVSEPDLASPDEARAYLHALRTLVRYLDISDGNMQEGNLRCEPNINLLIEERGCTVRTPIVEIKNLNSIRHVERAVRSEIWRQLVEYEQKGAAVEQEARQTFGYDEGKDTTFPMRLKEACHDYRYFPEPDIPPIGIGTAWREEAAARVPELPADKRRRFAADYGLSDYDADLLCREREVAGYFEGVVAAGAAPKQAANWISGEVTRQAHERGRSVTGLELSAARLAALIGLVERGAVARAAAAREVLPRMLEEGEEPARIIEVLNLGLVEDTDLLRGAARKAVEANPKAAEDVRAGKKKAFDALMGHVMEEFGGRANPKLVREVLMKILTPGS